MSETALTRLWPLVEALADAQWRSGTELCEQLNVSRAVLWKRIQQLAEFGLEVEAERGRGYRLRHRVEFLSAQRILEQLTQISDLTVCRAVGSTNATLLAGSELAQTNPDFLLAEWQSAGRGRRGREWLSPLGANIYLSFRWRFDQGLTALSGFSLALGVELARELDGLGVEGVKVKWPNDLHVDGRKLAGVLIELRGEAQGPVTVVAGIGINLYLAAKVLEQIDQPAIGIYQAMAQHVDRNVIAAAAVRAGQRVCAQFAEHGLTPWLADWQRFDALAGKPIRISGGNQLQEGVAEGIDPHGHLLLNTGDGQKVITAGEASVRHVAT